MVTHKLLTVGSIPGFQDWNPISSSYCIVLISSVCSLPFQGVLCASLSSFMVVSLAKFLPLVFGFSCTLGLPLFLLSTNYCFCMLIKGHAVASCWWLLPPPFCSWAQNTGVSVANSATCFHSPLIREKMLCGQKQKFPFVWLCASMFACTHTDYLIYTDLSIL